MALNVMIVDDSAAMRKIIKQTLKMSGLIMGQLHQAANGREGLDILEKNWVDLMFLDLNMPVMGGIEMIENIRQREEWSDLTIIVVSSETSRTRIQALDNQGILFIHKPFTPEQVREKIKIIIKGDVFHGNPGTNPDADSQCDF